MMNGFRPRKLMAVFAHPDDESLGLGPTLARYAAEGVETSLVMATRGQKGWKLGDYPGPEAVGRHRTRELEAAAEVLGIGHLAILDYADGELDRVAPMDAVIRIAAEVRRVRPDVVVTFGLDGAYGHPDHIAISQFTSAAIVKAAGSAEELAGLDPHQVSKLYFLAETRPVMAAYQEVFGQLGSKVNGTLRRFEGYDDWMVSARLDTRAYGNVVRRAILCHRSQLRDYQGLLELPAERWNRIFGHQTFTPRLQSGGGRP